MDILLGTSYFDMVDNVCTVRQRKGRRDEVEPDVDFCKRT